MDADTYYTPIIPELSRSNTCKLYEINHGPPTHFNNLLTPPGDSKAMDNKSTYNLRPTPPPPQIFGPPIITAQCYRTL